MSAGEPSGDRLGAELIVALRARVGNTRPLLFSGLPGPQMEALGVRRVDGARFLEPAMGVAEVVRHLGDLRRNRAALVAAAADADLYVGIDSPDFTLPTAARIRARGVRTIAYVSPQLWAWRPGRAPAVAAAVDQLLCLFPFEPPLYAGTGLDARCVGHPAVDRVQPSRREPGVLAIFPGSRASERRRHLAVFLDAARLAGAREILVAEAPGTTFTAASGGLDRLPDGVRVVPGPEALARADRALSKSGTVTLELALAGIPTVVAHRVHPITYALGRLLVRGVRHLALPNVLCGEEVMPEYVQHFHAPELARRLSTTPEPPVARLRGMLGEAGVAARAADAILGR